MEKKFRVSSLEFGDNENNINSEGEKSRTRKNEAKPARMVLFENFKLAIDRGLPVGPDVLKASDGNSGKRLTSQEKHCKKFSQWLVFG